MILFSFDAYKQRATAIKDTVQIGEYELSRHPNREIFLRVKTPIRDEVCGIIGTIEPPEENLFHVLLLAHALKKEGATRILVILPSVSYARQDKEKAGESIAIKLIGNLFAAANIDSVVTVDLHSEAAQKLFGVPIVSLSPAGLFADALKKDGVSDTTLVAPDWHAVARCEAIAAAANITRPVAYFKKQRTAHGVEHIGPFGDVSDRVVIVDDILDTGGTLIGACERLRAGNVRDISIMVTHGLFTGSRWKTLWDSGVRRIYCTDSVASMPTDDRIISFPVFSLIADHLKRTSG